MTKNIFKGALLVLSILLMLTGFIFGYSGDYARGSYFLIMSHMIRCIANDIT